VGFWKKTKIHVKNWEKYVWRLILHSFVISKCIGLPHINTPVHGNNQKHTFLTAFYHGYKGLHRFFHVNCGFLEKDKNSCQKLGKVRLAIDSA
jgi:hypothetical protein